MKSESETPAPKKTRKRILKILAAAIVVIIFPAGMLLYTYWLNQYAELEVCNELKVRLKLCDARLQDWADLGRYREANAELATQSENEDRVVFMGDSITAGWDLVEYFPDKAYINRGIHAQTTPQMLLRFRPDVIALKPKVVVILAGTNDIAGVTGPAPLETIRDNLTSMTELARTHNIQVVMASVLPVREDPKGKIYRPHERIIALNRWIREYAERNNLAYLDYYSAMSDENGSLREELSDDGLHPNDKGYSVMAPHAARAIGSALVSRTK